MYLPGLELKAVSIHWSPGGRGKGGGGRSAAGAGAYRSGTRLHDTFLDREFDYTRKEGVLHTELVGWEIREGETYAEAQQRLWAEADRNEKRVDSRTFWDLRFTLPRELTVSQQIEVLREIARDVRREFGVACDLALHKAHKLKEPRFKRSPAENPHGHVGFTTREVENGVFRPAKQRRLNTKKALRWIRRRIGRVINRHLARLGHAVRVTHRSLAAEYRKLNRRRAAKELPLLETPEATRHRGPRATHRLRREKGCRIEEENERITARNHVALDFNTRVLALDDDLLRARESVLQTEASPVNGGSAIPPSSDMVQSVVGAPESAGVVRDHEPAITRTSPDGSRDESPLEQHTKPIGTEDRSATEALAESDGLEPLPQATAEELRGEIFALKTLLVQDDAHRREWERQISTALSLIPQCLAQEDVARARMAAQSSIGWKQLVADIRGFATREPGLAHRASMLVSAHSRQAWENHRHNLRELAQSLESAWSAQAQLLRNTERQTVEEQVKRAGAALRALNEQTARKSPDQARGVTLPGRTSKGERGL